MSNSDSPGALYWSLIEPVWATLNESWDSGPKPFLELLNSLPRKIRYLYAGHWCQSEVCNGGLEQFFSNSSGILAPEARDAFHDMKLAEWSDTLHHALAFFGPDYPRDRDERVAMISGWPRRNREHSDPFYDLDEQFYGWLHAESDRWERAADHYALSNAR